KQSATQGLTGVPDPEQASLKSVPPLLHPGLSGSWEECFGILAEDVRVEVDLPRSTAGTADTQLFPGLGPVQNELAHGRLVLFAGDQRRLVRTEQEVEQLHHAGLSACVAALVIGGSGGSVRDQEVESGAEGDRAKPGVTGFQFTQHRQPLG